MPKFSANLSMLFGDAEFPGRFDRAAGELEREGITLPIGREYAPAG